MYRSTARRRSGSLSSRSPTSTPRAARRSERGSHRARSARARLRPAAYWRAEQLLGLADHGSSSQSRTSQSVSSSSHRPARVDAARERASTALDAVVEERPAGSGVDRAAARRCRSARGHAVVAADDRDRARAHVLLLADDLRDALACGTRRTPRRGARAAPARCGWRSAPSWRQVDEPARVDRESAHHLEGAGRVSSRIVTVRAAASGRSACRRRPRGRAGRARPLGAGRGEYGLAGS